MVASERCGLSEGRDGVPESHRFPKPGASWSYELSFPATCAKQARQIWMSIGKGRGTWTRDVFAVDGDTRCYQRLKDGKFCRVSLVGHDIFVDRSSAPRETCPLPVWFCICPAWQEISELEMRWEQSRPSCTAADKLDKTKYKLQDL